MDTEFCKLSQEEQQKVIIDRQREIIKELSINLARASQEANKTRQKMQAISEIVWTY